MALRVTGVARLTRDPELSYLSSEKAICKVGLAVDQGYGDKKSTCFVDGVAFGKTAETMGQYLSKGRQLYIEDAHLQYEEWADKATGAKRRKHSLIIGRMEFVGPKPDDAAPATPPAPTAGPAIDEEDIPF